MKATRLTASSEYMAGILGSCLSERFNEDQEDRLAKVLVVQEDFQEVCSKHCEYQCWSYPAILPFILKKRDCKSRKWKGNDEMSFFAILSA